MEETCKCRFLSIASLCSWAVCGATFLRSFLVGFVSAAYGLIGNGHVLRGSAFVARPLFAAGWRLAECGGGVLLAIGLFVASRRRGDYLRDACGHLHVHWGKVCWRTSHGVEFSAPVHTPCWRCPLALTASEYSMDAALGERWWRRNVGHRPRRWGFVADCVSHPRRGHPIGRPLVGPRSFRHGPDLFLDELLRQPPSLVLIVSFRHSRRADRARHFVMVLRARWTPVMCSSRWYQRPRAVLFPWC